MLTKVIPVKKQIIIIRNYLNGGQSIRTMAKELGIHYITLWRWVEQYRVDGEEGIKRKVYYRRPWNRTRRDLEEKIVLLKENEPALTVRKAKEILEKEGIRISIRGIWGAWKRYGYAGFNKENVSNDFLDYYTWTKEAEKKFARSKELFNLGAIQKSAEILNSIPALPENDLILQIPDSLLNVRRRIEKIKSLFGKIPVSSYLEKVRNFYEECKRGNLYYSALRLGLTEVVALSWSGEPIKMLKKTEELKNILKMTGDHCSHLPFAPRFSLLISEGIAYAAFLKIKKASEIARTCRKLLKKRKHISPHFMLDLGQLYTYLLDFGEAEYWYLKSLDKADGETKEQGKNLLANIFILKGEYKKAIHILKNEKLDEWGCHSEGLFAQSIWSLINGMPQKAISLATEALSLIKKEEVRVRIFRAYFTIASAYCSLGERAKAESILKRVLLFFVKNKLKQFETIAKILLSRTPKTQFCIQLSENLLPSVKVVLLLKNGHYRKAYQFANRYKLLGFFHRLVLLIPEPVIKMLEKGKDTGLPRALLNLPVFNKEIPVYSVKFLGNLVVHKNQKYLRVHPVRKKTQVASSDKFSSERCISLASRVRRKPSIGVKLSPKDTSFLIYLASSKNKSIPLDRIYRNFWPDSKNPSRNLAHLLVRTRESLRLPSHYLYVKKDRLCYDCYFTTDYGEYVEHLAQAKALERAGEWAFAKQEYFRAFKLFRGEPFKKMYDDWSDDKRLEIIFSYETELIAFAKELIKRGRKEEARKLLKKAEGIVPDIDLRPET